MQVRIEVLPWLSELAGGSSARKVTLEENLPDGGSLRSLLVRVNATHERLGRMVFDPGKGHLTGHAEIAVNGTLYDQAGGLDLLLHDGDTVSFLPGVAGGSSHWY